MKDIVVLGSSGHAKVVIDIIEKQNKYNILGIYVDTEEDQGKFIYDYKVLGKIDGDFISSNGIVAIGDNFGRKMVVNRVLELVPNFNFICAIHPSSIIAKDVIIEDGTVVVAGAILNASAKVGSHSIINTNSSIGHDVVIGDFSTISPGVSIGGNTRIGSSTTIALGCNVIQKILIGNEVLVGAGSTVINHIPNYVLAFGTPAKIIRKRNFDEKFL